MGVNPWSQEYKNIDAAAQANKATGQNQQTAYANAIAQTNYGKNPAPASPAATGPFTSALKNQGTTVSSGLSNLLITQPANQDAVSKAGEIVNQGQNKTSTLSAQLKRLMDEKEAKTQVWENGIYMGENKELAKQYDAQIADVQQQLKAEQEKQAEASKPKTSAARDEYIRQLNELIAYEGYATTVEQADAVNKQKNELRQKLHEEDQRLGNAARFYDSGERNAAIIRGGLGQIGSAYTNLLGTIKGVGNRLIESSNEFDQRVAASPYSGWATDPLTAANIAAGTTDEQLEQGMAQMLEDEQSLYQSADTQLEKANAEIAQAKEGLSGLGQFGVDAATTLIQLGVDAAGSATGLGMLPMFARAAGSSMQEARQAGASTGQQVFYGLTKGAIEVGTEKLFDGVAGLFGRGVADDVVESVVKRLADSDTGRTLIRAFAGASGEGTEEAISDLLDPFAKLIYNDQALREAWENRSDLASDMLYDYLLGFSMGGLGSVTSVATGQDAAKNAELRAIESPAQNTTAQTVPAATQTGATAPQTAQATNANVSAVYQVLSSGRVNNTMAETIAADPGLSQAFTAVTGIELSGTTNDKRTTIQQAARDLAYRNSQVNAAVQAHAEAETQLAAQERADQQRLSEQQAAYAQQQAQEQAVRNSGYDSYIRGMALKGMTVADAREILRNPELKSTWERLSGIKLPESSNRAVDIIRNTRLDIGSLPSVDVPTAAQTAQEAAGDIQTPATPKNASTAPTAELNQTQQKIPGQELLDYGNSQQTATAQSAGADLLNYGKGGQNNTAPQGAETVHVVERLRENIPQLSEMPSVASANSYEIYAAPGKNMAEKAKSLFEKIKGVVARPGFGDVEINTRSVKDDLSHGVGVAKASVIPSIPNVIKNGTQIDFQENWKGRPYDGYVFAAPVTLDGKTVYVAAVVKQTSKNRFYLHEVVDSEGNVIKIKGGETANPTSLASVDDAGAISPLSTPESNGTGGEAVASPTSSIPNTPQNVNTETGGKIPFTPKGVKPAPETPNERVSQFWSNTVRNTERRAKNRSASKTPITYTVKGEAQSIQEAASRLFTDEQGTIQQLINSEAWSGVQADAAAQVANELYTDGVKNGDMTAYVEWVGIMQSHVTETARGIQANAKYTRDTGQNITRSVIRQLYAAGFDKDKVEPLAAATAEYAQRYEAATKAKTPDGSYTSEQIADLRQLASELSVYRRTGTFVKSNFEKLLAKVNDGTWLDSFVRNQILSIGGDAISLTRADIGNKISTRQVLGQLTSLATTERNIGGNVLFGLQDTMGMDTVGLALDSLVSKFTGQRSVGFDKGIFSSEGRRLAADAMVKSVLEVAGDVNISNMQNMTGRSSSRTFKMAGGPVQQFYSRWEQLLSYLLTVPDQASKGLTQGSIAESLGSIGVDKESSQQIAENDAAYRVFQNTNTATQLAQGTHDLLNTIGFGGKRNGAMRQGGFGLGDVLIRYPKVPTNIALKSAEFGPIGAAKGVFYDIPKLILDGKRGTLTPKQQRQAIATITRGISGTALVAFSVGLAINGLIKNYDDEEDYDLSAANQAEGRRGIAWNLSGTMRWLMGGDPSEQQGDEMVQIEWLQPLNAFLYQGDLIAKELESGEATPLSIAGAYFEGTMNSILDMPVFSSLAGIEDIINSVNTEKGVASAATDFAGDTFAGFVPAPIRHFANVFDQYKRDTSADTAWEQAVNRTINNIPGLRNYLLPEKLDNYGNSISNNGDTFVRRFANSVLLPGAVTEITQTPVQRVLSELYQQNGEDASIYPDRAAPYKLSFDDVDYELSTRERRAYQATAGNESERLITQFASMPIYGSMTAEEKSDIIKQLNSFAEDAAKREFADDRGIEYTNDTWNKAAALSNPTSYIVAKEILSLSRNERQSFEATDYVIQNFYTLPQDVQDKLLDDSSTTEKLLLAAENGISSEKWYSDYDAGKILGDAAGTDADVVKMIATWQNTSGTQEEKMAAIESQLLPADGGLRNSQVRRLEAYTNYVTAIGGTPNVEQWFDIVAAMRDAGATSYVSKEKAQAAYNALGVGGGTYAGLTWNKARDVYNTFFEDEKYAQQYDTEYGEAHPKEEKQTYVLDAWRGTVSQQTATTNNPLMTYSQPSLLFKTFDDYAAYKPPRAYPLMKYAK